jgi:hypothetical protein
MFFVIFLFRDAISIQFEWYEWWIMKVLFRHFYGATDENYEKLCQNSRCFGLDSIQSPPEYNSKNIMFLDIVHPLRWVSTWKTEKWMGDKIKMGMSCKAKNGNTSSESCQWRLC